jgi:serine/threonine-protein kinase
VKPTTPADKKEVIGVTSVIDQPTPMPELDETVNLSHESALPQSSTTTIAVQDAAFFVEALRSTEIQRVRRLVPVLMVLTLMAAGFLFTFAGDANAKSVVMAGIGFGVVSGLYLYYLTLDEARYTEGRVVLANSILLLALYTPVYFVGVFSVASVLIVLAIFLMGVDRRGTGAFVLYAVAACCHIALAAVFAQGMAVDIGIMSSASLTSGEIWAAEGLVQVTFLISLVIARGIRIQLSGAVDEHEDRVREHARRGALLEEAREALDRAQHASGRGSFTGQQLGSYKLDTLLGRGGTGEVYNATHVDTEESAAVKLLSLPALSDPGHLDRFIREAEVAAKVVSPHVVRLFEVSGEDSPLPYIAMERLEGKDLSHFLRDTGAMSIESVITMVTHVAKGLDAAREVGIVHRDISPRNLYRTGEEEAPVWKILDFGISKHGNTSTTLTQGNAIGTPRYMSPEQSRGLSVDHRADVYSLAAVAYRALTGRPPVIGGDVPQVLQNVAYQMPDRPGAHADLPSAIDYVLLIGLSKSPDDRFDTALALAEALAAASLDKIEAQLKSKGAALAQRHPWGSRVRHSSPASSAM